MSCWVKEAFLDVYEGYVDTECPDETILSLWASRVPLDQFPEDYYFKEEWCDEDPFTGFQKEFLISYFDIDFLEDYHVGGKVVPIGELLKPLSYSEFYLEQAIAKAKEVSMEFTNYVVILLYQNYDPKKTGIIKGKRLTFIGAFEFPDI